MKLVVREAKTPARKRFCFSFIKALELESDEVYVIKGVKTPNGGCLAFLKYDPCNYSNPPQDICIIEFTKCNIMFPPGKAKYITVEVPDYINIQQSAIVKHRLPPTTRKIKV